MHRDRYRARSSGRGGVVGARREAVEVTIELHHYQSVFVDRLRAAFRRHKSVLGVAPPGSGKTVVSAHIAREAAAKGMRVLFTVHREELVHQTAATFDAFGISYGYVKAGMVYDRTPMVHIASIATLRNRLDTITAPNLLVVDEAHLARADTWHDVVAHYRANGAFILGNSGSPQRLDGKGLGDLFDDIVLGPTTAELIASGHLSGYRYFRGEAPDVGATKAAYKTAALEQSTNTRALVGDIAGRWLQLASDRRTVCFTISHAHSASTIEEFCSRGVRAESISSKSSKPERKRIIEEFADGAIRVLCNVELITTGFDLAAQVGRDVTVDAIIMARPTQSLALYLQMVGRGLRRKPYPCIILDHAGNSSRHGFPDDPREWSLDGEGMGATKLQPPPLECGRCFCQVRRPAPRACPHCAAPWEESPESNMRRVEYDAAAQLVEVTPEQREAERRIELAQRKFAEGKCKTLEDLEALGRERGYKAGWAAHRWAARQQRGAER